MKRLMYKKFYGGISNDPNIGGDGSVYNSEGVETREDVDSVILARGGVSTSKIATSDIVVGYNYFDSSHYLRLHSSGRVCNIFKNNPDLGSYVVDLSGTAYNIGNLTTPIGNRGFIITSTQLHQWNYDSGLSSLGIYNDTSAGLVANGDFSGGGTSWTYTGSDWTFAGGSATHASGNTTTLSQVLTTVNTKIYRVEVQTAGIIEAGSCVVKMGGTTIGTINTTGQSVVGLRTATSTSETLEFIPTTDFVGKIEDVEVNLYNVTTYTQTFNENAPFIVIQNFIYIGNGNTITEVDTTTDTWILTDVLTIDLDYTIKGITKIGDQVFIYASNGSSSKQYLWDGVNTTSNRVITWVDKNVINVANWANQDYVITKSSFSKRTGLYLVNGYQLQKIFENPTNQDSTLERIYFNPIRTNSIETIGYKLLIPGEGGIYTYGQFTPGFNNSLVKEYLHNGGDITAMYYNESNSLRLVYSYLGTIGGVTGVYETLVQYTGAFPAVPNISGFIELHPISGECISNIKNLEKITIGYKLETSTYINVYTKNIDRTIKYANIPYNYTIIPTIGAIYTFNGNTYTIYNVTDLGDYCVLHCTYTGNSIETKGTFTKSSGTGDASLITEKVRYGFKLVGQISSTTDRRKEISPTECFEEFNEISIGVELLSGSTSKTPKLNDINIYFNETTDD